MPWMFNEDDLAAQRALRSAFAPLGLANPSKVLPSPASCGDAHEMPEGVWI
jgi:glycolate oxidase